VIYNIIDGRDRKHRWRSVKAIVEATSHDNRVPDSDQVQVHADDVSYDEREGISVSEAVAWAQSFPGPVTLFLYDEGRGTR
jgi:hypothetical protein